MAMKKKPNAAGVLTAGKKDNTKAKVEPNADLLAWYKQLLKAQHAFAKYKEAWASMTDCSAIRKYESFFSSCDMLFTVRQTKSVCDLLCKFVKAKGGAR